MIDPNKKKIRGWKRRAGHVDAWFEKYKRPDVESFKRKGEDYVTVRIDPWNRLCERVPPSWYFKLIIEKLLEIHDYWKRSYNELKQPFDIQIWLNDPNTIRSQVVCASVDKPGDQRNSYYRISKDKIQFPIAKWKSADYDLERFEWILFDDEDLRFKNLEGLDEEEINELRGMGFKEEQTILNGEPEIMYVRKVGYVWVGREK